VSGCTCGHKKREKDRNSGDPLEGGDGCENGMILESRKNLGGLLWVKWVCKKTDLPEKACLDSWYVWKSHGHPGDGVFLPKRSYLPVEDAFY
jgi:hypothetical protein